MALLLSEAAAVKQRRSPETIRTVLAKVDVERQRGHTQRVTVWHGTTASRAEQIRVHGFNPVDVDTELRSIAADHDVEVPDLRRALVDHGRFAAAHGLRSELAWVTTRRDLVLAWAERAPEIRWEALWAVWWVKHDPDDWAPWASPGAAAWHAKQLFGTAPVALELEVPNSAIRDRNGDPLTEADVNELVRLGVPELAIKPPGDAAWLRGVLPVRRTVTFTAVAGLLNMGTDELGHLVDGGAIPSPRSGKSGMDWTWYEDELDSFVPAEQLRP